MRIKPVCQHIVIFGLLLLPLSVFSAETSAHLSLGTEKDKQATAVNQTQQEDESKNKVSGIVAKNPDADQGQSNSSPNNPQNAQKIFEESLRQMMPLDQGQIQQYRERSDERDKALLPVSPNLASRTIRVSLEPGQKPVPVYTTANIATSLVFHDSTGQPWPITSVTNGGPTFFQVLKPELPDGNILNVMPTQAYSSTTLVVTLEKRDVPLIIKLESDSVRAPERKGDALVLFQLAHHGPRASIPVLKNIKETANSTMLSFLDRVPPKDAVRLRIDPADGDLLGWEYNGKHYLRTTDMLVWPAWIAVVNGAGDTKCYEVEPTPRVMISRDGVIQTLLLKKGK